MNQIKKLTAILVAAVFLVQEAAWAAPLSQDPSRFEAPLEFATLQEIYSAKGPQNKLIIHIQDAHSNLSGQENLAKALDQIMTRYGVNLVLSEGGANDCSLTPIKKLASPAVWKRIARSYLLQGKISGEEYLNLVSDHPMKIMGLEDITLYLKSVRNYAELADQREAILDYLKKIESAVEKIKRKIYPKELVEYEKAKHGRENMEGEWKALAELAQEKNIDLSEFSNLTKLVELELQEKLIDFNLANLEQAALVEEISQRGGTEDLKKYFEKVGNTKDSKASQYAIFQNALNIAKEKNILLTKYPTLMKYGEYLKAFSDLDLDQVLGELEKAEDKVYKTVILGAVPAANGEQFWRVLPPAGLFSSSSVTAVRTAGEKRTPLRRHPPKLLRVASPHPLFRPQSGPIAAQSKKQGIGSPASNGLTDDALLVRSIDRYLKLLSAAYHIQMTTKEFQTFLANEPDFSTTAYLAFLNRKLAELGYFADLIPSTNVLEQGKKSLKAFYESVTQRDVAFIENTEKILNNADQTETPAGDTVVLITGGYHTQHLKQLFKEKGYSYVVLTPIVTSETNQEKYEKLLLAPVKPEVKKVEVINGETSPDKSLSALEKDLIQDKQPATKASAGRSSGVRVALAVAAGRLVENKSQATGDRLYSLAFDAALSTTGNRAEASRLANEAMKEVLTGARLAQLLPEEEAPDSGRDGLVGKMRSIPFVGSAKLSSRFASLAGKIGFWGLAAMLYTWETALWEKSYSLTENPSYSQLADQASVAKDWAEEEKFKKQLKEVTDMKKQFIDRIERVHQSGRPHSATYAAEVDRIVRRVAEITKIPKEIALLAAGSYARREQVFGTDFELVVVISDNLVVTEEVKQSLKKFYDLLSRIDFKLDENVIPIFEAEVFWVKEAVLLEAIKTNRIEWLKRNVLLDLRNIRSFPENKSSLENIQSAIKDSFMKPDQKAYGEILQKLHEFLRAFAVTGGDAPKNPQETVAVQLYNMTHPNNELDVKRDWGFLSHITHIVYAGRMLSGVVSPDNAIEALRGNGFFTDKEAQDLNDALNFNIRLRSEVNYLFREYLADQKKFREKYISKTRTKPEEQEPGKIYLPEDVPEDASEGLIDMWYEQFSVTSDFLDISWRPVIAYKLGYSLSEFNEALDHSRKRVYEIGLSTLEKVEGAKKESERFTRFVDLLKNAEMSPAERLVFLKRVEYQSHALTEKSGLSSDYSADYRMGEALFEGLYDVSNPALGTDDDRSAKILVGGLSKGSTGLKHAAAKFLFPSSPPVPGPKREAFNRLIDAFWDEVQKEPLSVQNAILFELWQTVFRLSPYGGTVVLTLKMVVLNYPNELKKAVSDFLKLNDDESKDPWRFFHKIYPWLSSRISNELMIEGMSLEDLVLVNQSYFFRYPYSSFGKRMDSIIQRKVRDSPPGQRPILRIGIVGAAFGQELISRVLHIGKLLPEGVDFEIHVFDRPSGVYQRLKDNAIRYPADMIQGHLIVQQDFRDKSVIGRYLKAAGPDTLVRSDYLNERTHFHDVDLLDSGTFVFEGLPLDYLSMRNVAQYIDPQSMEDPSQFGETLEKLKQFLLTVVANNGTFDYLHSEKIRGDVGQALEAVEKQRGGPQGPEGWLSAEEETAGARLAEKGISIWYVNSAKLFSRFAKLAGSLGFWALATTLYGWERSLWQKTYSVTEKTSYLKLASQAADARELAEREAILQTVLRSRVNLESIVKVLEWFDAPHDSRSGVRVPLTGDAFKRPLAVVYGAIGRDRMETEEGRRLVKFLLGRAREKSGARLAGALMGHTKRLEDAVYGEMVAVLVDSDVQSLKGVLKGILAGKGNLTDFVELIKRGEIRTHKKISDAHVLGVMQQNRVVPLLYDALIEKLKTPEAKEALRPKGFKTGDRIINTETGTIRIIFSLREDWVTVERIAGERSRQNLTQKELIGLLNDPRFIKWDAADQTLWQRAEEVIEERDRENGQNRELDKLWAEAKTYHVGIHLKREMSERTLAYLREVVSALRDPILQKLLSKLGRRTIQLDVDRLDVEKGWLGFAYIDRTVAPFQVGVTQYFDQGTFNGPKFRATFAHEIIHKLATATDETGDDLILPVRDWIALMKVNGLTKIGESDIDEYLFLDPPFDDKTRVQEIIRRIRRLRGDQFLPHGSKQDQYRVDPQEIVAWTAVGKARQLGVQNPEATLQILQKNLLRFRREDGSSEVFSFNPITGEWHAVEENAKAPVAIGGPILKPDFIENTARRSRGEEIRRALRNPIVEGRFPVYKALPENLLDDAIQATWVSGHELRDALIEGSVVAFQRGERTLFSRVTPLAKAALSTKQEEVAQQIAEKVLAAGFESADYELYRRQAEKKEGAIVIEDATAEIFSIVAEAMRSQKDLELRGEPLVLAAINARVVQILIAHEISGARLADMPSGKDLTPLVDEVLSRQTAKSIADQLTQMIQPLKEWILALRADDPEIAKDERLDEISKQANEIVEFIRGIKRDNATATILLRTITKGDVAAGNVDVINGMGALVGFPELIKMLPDKARDYISEMRESLAKYEKIIETIQAYAESPLSRPTQFVQGFDNAWLINFNDFTGARAAIQPSAARLATSLSSSSERPAKVLVGGSESRSTTEGSSRLEPPLAPLARTRNDAVQKFSEVSAARLAASKELTQQNKRLWVLSSVTHMVRLFPNKIWYLDLALGKDSQNKQEKIETGLQSLEKSFAHFELFTEDFSPQGHAEFLVTNQATKVIVTEHMQGYEEEYKNRFKKPMLFLDKNTLAREADFTTIYEELRKAVAEYRKVLEQLKGHFNKNQFEEMKKITGPLARTFERRSDEASQFLNRYEEETMRLAPSPVNAKERPVLFSAVYAARLAQENIQTPQEAREAAADEPTRLLLARAYLADSRNLFGKVYDFLVTSLSKNARVEFFEDKASGGVYVKIYKATREVGRMELTDLVNELHQTAKVSEAITPSREELLKQTYPMVQSVAEFGSIHRAGMKVPGLTAGDPLIIRQRIRRPLLPGEKENLLQGSKAEIQRVFTNVYFEYLDENGQRIEDISDTDAIQKASHDPKTRRVYVDELSDEAIGHAHDLKARALFVEPPQQDETATNVLPYSGVYIGAMIVGRLDSLANNEFARQFLSRLTASPFDEEKFNLLKNPDTRQLEGYRFILVRRITRVAIDQFLEFTHLVLKSVTTAA